MLTSVKIAAALLMLLAAPPPADVTVGREMSGQTVTLARGRTIAVKLPSNVATGYSWGVTALPRILRAAGDTYLGPADPSPGAAGAQLLRFETTRRGRGVLRLVYRRRWETGRPRPAERFSIVVDAR